MRFFRSRLKFSLRTLFVVLTIFCLWIGYHLNWIRERHDAREFLREFGVIWLATGDEAPAPWRLRMLGEPGVSFFAVGFPGSSGTQFDRKQKIFEFRRLFPEAYNDDVVDFASPTHPPLDSR